MTSSTRVHVALHTLTGGLLLAAAGLSVYGPWGLGRWYVHSQILLGLGLTLLAARRLSPAGRPGRGSAKLCLALLSLSVLLGLAEGVGRVSGFGATMEAAALRRVPPYYRKPTVPSGTIFFRRQGPDTWTGQARRAYLDLLGVQPNPYTREPTVTVEYDGAGFRNPPGLSRWNVAVAGDSFTELGYLPADALFTSVAARALGVPVKNLGTSYTGPLTQLHYLETYGLSPDTRQVVISFFEGNDLGDLDREAGALTRWRSTGQREFLDLPRQASVVRALGSRLAGLLGPFMRPAVAGGPNATFASANGDVPVTLIYTPPGRDGLSPVTQQQLRDFVAQYAAFGRAHHVETWLAYMPAKERVLHGRVTFAPDVTEALRRWDPGDLPAYIGELCRAEGIRFIDPTQALIDATTSTHELTYSSVLDSHLSTLGARIVGQELARHLATHD